MRFFAYRLAGLAAVALLAFVFAPQMASSRGVGLHLAPWSLTALLAGGVAYTAASILQRFPGAGIAAAAVVAFLAGPALAGEPTVYAVALPKELLPMVLDYVFVGLLALLGWVIKRVADWLHISRESKLVERLEDGMGAALMFARERALEQGKDLKDFNARSALVADAANYLLPKLPDTLKALKVDPDGLRERLTGRLGYIAPLSAPSAASAPHD